QIEGVMLTEEHIILDNDEVDDEIMHEVSPLLNNEDNFSNDLTDSIVNPRVIIYPLKANVFQTSTTPHGSTISLSINNKSNELINLQNKSDDNSSEITLDENNVDDTFRGFEERQFESSSLSSQLEGCEIEDTQDYKKTLQVVSDNDDLTSQNMNATLTNVIEKLNLDSDNISEVENDKAKVLKNKLTNNSLKLYKDKLFLNSNSIGKLLNLICCPFIILVEAGITAKFLMRSTVEEYDCFLKSLLNDNDASYQSPEFDSTIIHW
ncbi:4255_t:CDS:2, partial [Gigaspora margarita]